MPSGIGLPNGDSISLQSAAIIAVLLPFSIWLLKVIWTYTYIRFRIISNMKVDMAFRINAARKICRKTQIWFDTYVMVPSDSQSISLYSLPPVLYFPSNASIYDGSVDRIFKYLRTSEGRAVLGFYRDIENFEIGMKRLSSLVESLRSHGNIPPDLAYDLIKDEVASVQKKIDRIESRLSSLKSLRNSEKKWVRGLGLKMSHMIARIEGRKSMKNWQHFSGEYRLFNKDIMKNMNDIDHLFTDIFSAYFMVTILPILLIILVWGLVGWLALAP